MRGQVNHAEHGGGAAHWRGRQGRLGWRRIVAGSGGVPHGQGGMALTGGILAAVGRFPQDEVVLARASRIAAAHGLALSVVHVVDLGGPAPLPGATALLAEAAGAAVRTDIAAALKRIGATHPGNLIHIETGAPALRLIEVAEELRPDLVVMRMNQRNRITARVLGSTTDRVIAPPTPSCSGASSPEPIGSRPREGFSPTTPQVAAGMRIDPPPSDAAAQGSMPAATATAAPPLDPPAPVDGSHGLRAGGATADSV